MYDFNIKSDYQRLYVHVPFCVRKCAYCDFVSSPLADAGGLVPSYLEAVKLELGKGVRETDACIELLKVKLTRFGITFDNKGAYTLAINTGKLSAPAEEQGYILETAKDGAAIQGADKLGTLWGIVSFIQMIDQEKKLK